MNGSPGTAPARDLFSHRDVRDDVVELDPELPPPHLADIVVGVTALHLWLFPTAVLDVTVATEATLGEVGPIGRPLVMLVVTGTGMLVGLVPAAVCVLGFGLCWRRLGVTDSRHTAPSAALTAATVLAACAAALDGGLVGVARAFARALGGVPGERAYLALVVLVVLSPFVVLVSLLEAASLRAAGRPTGG